MSKAWREAASLIVVARDLTKNVKFDYKVSVYKLIVDFNLISSFIILFMLFLGIDI